MIAVYFSEEDYGILASWDQQELPVWNGRGFSVHFSFTVSVWYTVNCCYTPAMRKSQRLSI